MLRVKSSASGWRGAALVAVTYVYFLIFAQFAFLRRLADLGVAGAGLKFDMAAMALGGILFILLAPRVSLWPSATLRLRAAFVGCAVAAYLALLPLRFAGAAAVAFLIGAALGLLTVTLTAHLPRFAGNRHPLLMTGLGTGIGYFCCNVPWLFAASPQAQSVAAGTICIAGILITLVPAAAPVEVEIAAPRPPGSLTQVVLSFTALVWLDSAAFFILQNTPDLQAATWRGSSRLWIIAALHLCAALVAAWLLAQRRLSAVLSAAFLVLGSACLLLSNAEHAVLAIVLYPVGVSLYSVALVAYPSLVAPAASDAERGRIAGWIYAIAGWAGSAMGIGMGQNLGRVPRAFVIVAGAAILLPSLIRLLRRRSRELAAVGAVLLAALCIDRILHPAAAAAAFSPVERGRMVYISEGCIHCHSQYIRPNSPDVLMWGPAQSIDEIRRQHPPLIGNRRQGPDLSQVGARRSVLWLKAHFFNPAEVSGASIMPAYGFLFRDQRGDDMVAYLASLHSPSQQDRLAAERAWQPAADAIAQASAADGEQLYWRDCATCHDARGGTRRAWLKDFPRPPQSFAAGPFLDLSPSDPPQRRLLRLEQIAKFGIPGTDMPGHEYLSDREIASLGLWLSQTAQQHEPGI